MVRNTAREIAIHLSYELSFTGKTVEELAEVCLLLLENEEKRAAMRQSLREMGLGNAAKTIYETMKENAKELQEV